MINYNIEIRRFNGIDYDICYPVTTIENVNNLQSILNKKTNLKTFSITLSSSGWSGNGSTTPYTQQVAASEVLNTDNIFIQIIPSSTYSEAINQATQFQYISYTSALNGAIKFTCLTLKPTITLNVKVFCFS